jgi:crotonobetainyl-CoA:carnitine CoA-transferase CaiB-like acyl-CoA transferase
VSQPARSRPAALAGVYVLELGRGVSAPWCTRLLAGLGAEVVKLEPPDGDPARAWGTPPDAAAGATGALFAWLNAGKRSVRLAGDTARDAALVDELAARADVVVTNLDASGSPSRGSRAPAGTPSCWRSAPTATRGRGQTPQASRSRCAPPAA